MQPFFMGGFSSEARIGEGAASCGNGTPHCGLGDGWRMPQALITLH